MSGMSIMDGAMVLVEVRFEECRGRNGVPKAVIPISTAMLDHDEAQALTLALNDAWETLDAQTKHQHGFGMPGTVDEYRLDPDGDYEYVLTRTTTSTPTT